MKTKTKTIKRIISLSFIVIILVAVVIGNVIANRYQAEINSLLTPPVVNEQMLEQTRESGQALSKEIMQEGAVLVKNEDDTLPLSREADKQVNIFGHSTVDWGFGGSGSGRVRAENDDFSTTIDLLKAFTRYGISYNDDLIDMYKRFRSISRVEEGQDKNFYALYEPSIEDRSYYSDALLTACEEYSDTAIVTITRFGSEGVDHTMPGGNIRSGLEISEEEEGLLRYVGSHYEKVIVIINSANTMELGFLDTIPGLDACLIVGLTGTQAASAIPSILYGEVSPSGKLADTYAYAFENSISFRHYGQAGWYEPNGFYDYIEGIYVGYKWYETADAEEYWKDVSNEYGEGYEGVVQYPFGYGLSYTEFEWTLSDCVVREGDDVVTDGTITEKSEISLTVNVKNIGETAGKDVVEIYLTAPYYDGGIEKASVSLVGFEKTVLLAPQESQDIEIVLSANDFASYDCYGKNSGEHKGYELEAGTYTLRLMTDAHTSKNCTPNIVEFNVAQTIDIMTDQYSGAEVYNKFTGEDAWDGASIDGNDDGNVTVNYISRNDFPALSSLASPANRSLTDKQQKTSVYTAEEAQAWDNAKTDEEGNPTYSGQVVWGQDNGLSITENGQVSELGYELGQDYDNEKWDDLLNQLNMEEALAMINTGYASNIAIDSIGKPKLSDYDGPMQVKGFSGAPRSTGFPSEPVVAQTWNKELAKSLGMSFGKEMNALGVSGLYGFGVNIHRNPFCGRNFEYYSEDAYLSGAILSYAIMGLQNTGRMAYIKHLVLNDGEAGRTGAFTWCTEQALREIYLKPFQMAIQEGGCVALMTAYNRVGANYSGGSQALINGIVRTEWGFKGSVITDCAGPETAAYMNMDEALRAGGDLGMSTTLNAAKSGYTLDYSLNSSARLQYQIREAVHHVTYAYLRVQYLNKVYNETGGENEAIVSTFSIESWQWWRVLLIELDIFIVFGCVLWTYFLFRSKEYFDTCSRKSVRKQTGGKR